MRTLEFTVERQRLTKRIGCDFSSIVAGSIGYLRAQFYFSPEWAGCKKAASFWLEDKEYPVLLDSEDACLIPPEVLNSDRFSVSVTGARTGYKIKSTKTKVRQEV